MRRIPRTATLGLSTFALLALLAACGQVVSTQTPQAGGTPGAAVIVTRIASAESPAEGNHRLSVSVSCRPGEQMLAGGYAAVDVFESDYRVLSFYPAADNTWTVTTDSGSSYQLQAMVYCLAAYSSLGIRALQADACPAGMVRLGKGSKDADPFSGAAGIPYVLCATRGVTPTAHGIRVGTTELDCRSYATGDNQSESRTFSYTCATIHDAS